MLYLSQILDRPLFYGENPLGKVADLAVNEGRQMSLVSKILIKDSGLKFTIPSDVVFFKEGHWVAKTRDIPRLPYNEQEFYLAEDLLDKQVIDIDGRRLVRVNDVLIKENDELKVEGIDIGLSGIFRRLGLPNFLQLKTITLPWSLIGAFDYQTGNVHIKVTQKQLDTFHPAEIADILEETGTKERLGIVEALDVQKAASAIEEANTKTQAAILEQVPSSNLKNIVAKMRISRVADVLYKLNPFTSGQILTNLGHEEAKTLHRLSFFRDDVAGGLMDISFPQASGEQTIKEALEAFAERNIKPEAIVLINGGGKIVGVAYAKNFFVYDSSTPLKSVVSQKQFVYTDVSFYKILRLFANYNLRILPVVDRERRVVGAINIDSILTRIQEDQEKNAVL